MTAREHAYTRERLEAGHRATARLVALLDAGLDPTDALSATAPGLSPTAADAARRLAALVALYSFSCAVVLAGLVPDEVLGVVDIPEAPVRAHQVWQGVAR